MTLFHGCCIYAHGGFVTAALLASSIAGFVCTTYSAASCRFVRVEFKSERGNFDSLFSSQGSGNGFEPIQTGAGLYSWLAPSDSWDVGTCTGYTQSALEVISDEMLEAARFLVVIAIILGLGVLLWILSLACISLGPKQIYLLAACQLLLVILVPMSFLVLQSDLCNSVGQDTSCTIDEGAMVAIVAAVSWFIGFLICIFYMKSPEKERREREEEIQRRAEALAEKKRRKAARKQQKAAELAVIEQEMMEQEQVMQKSSTPGTPETVDSGRGGDEGYDAVELDMVRSLNRIQSLLDEDDEDYI